MLTIMFSLFCNLHGHKTYSINFKLLAKTIFTNGKLIIIYCIAGMFGCKKAGKFGELSVIHQT